ncbi:lytic polysaccharide monooxygenase [Aaosphaeria arxii CBS 175.79]|uniref:AA9 family lytic polysaccharide monooxygenase n=1 Tax=Aaosphaeria arxii CBS 175.79 TaxID=1450172 RepID=A0A6A5XXJ5_9PLEO|nr:lytic polysaccharide monooxygenase [Aaosphaeria arxii CBS 175.79]KAF2017679.1 lytic polysaccharide monooxygenase [Aaosphaeria arxii CBS 175.79]
MLQLYFTAVAYLAQLAAAHGGALNYTVGDTWYAGYDPFGPKDQDDAPYIVQRKWITNEPIFETTNASLACNFPGNPARAYIPINAGENITAVYNTWVHTVGPMIAWLTPCANNDCSTFDPAGAEWFKIGQQGLLWGTIEGGGWFQKEFSRWDGSPSLWSERIPETLRAGKYLVRHEIISLHSAHKPQFYPECAHLDVKGSGTGFPTKEFMAKIPGVYSMDQPEINIDVYDPEISTKTEYKIPGPLVWTG